MPVQDRSPLFVREYRSGRRLCLCGCGNATMVSTHNDASHGYVTGLGRDYIRGHSSRVGRSVAYRFAGKFEEDPETHCWVWTGAKQGSDPSDPYGALWDGNKKKILPHRVSYELFIGPIPKGLTLDHVCRTRLCVNPGHLEPVTNVVNVMRGEGPGARNARKTHCKHGHPFEGENLYIRPGGYRECRICKNNRQRQSRAEHVQIQVASNR